MKKRDGDAGTHPPLCFQAQGRWRSPLAAKALLLLAILSLAACGDDPVPKPRGYFRIDLPEARTLPYAGSCPFTAEVPAYARLVGGGSPAPVRDTTCWVNMLFPGQRAAVHMTYRRIAGDLPELINDAHAFKDKHEVKAVRIRTENVLRDSARVFGTLFDVDGDVASPMVFYLTDSTTHFLYGALYFDARPNADSLAPVTARIRADLRRFANTLNWR